MTKTLIAGAKIWDATGGPAFQGDLLVEGHRIAAGAPEVARKRPLADQDQLFTLAG